MKKNSIINALLIVFIFGFAAKGFSQTYCNSNFTSVTYEFITNVTYGGINNTTGGTIGGPVNYLSLGPANVTVGTASTLSVTIDPDGGDYVYAFIDWNHNGTLNDAGEVYTLASNVSTAGPFTVSVTPPPGAYIGITRMRVMLPWLAATPDPCYNATYGEAEDYSVNVQAANNCSTVTFPSSATVSAAPSTICVSGNVTLTMSTPTAMPSASGVTYKWQSATAAGGPYTDIPGAVTTVPTYTTVTPITTTTYYKCIVLCNTTTTVLTSAASAAVVVTNPGTPTVTGASRCGPGSVTLSAVPPTGSTINWYTSATGGIPVGTSNNYTTNYLPTTTTFYAAAASGSTAATPQIGSGTGSLPNYENGGPFSNYYQNQTAQYLYTSSEIIAAGGGAGTISTIAFNCTGLPVQWMNGANTILPNYKLYIMTVPSTMTTLTWQAASGFTQVYSNATFAPALGWNTLNLTTPFPYNGTDNIIIAMCYDQTQPSYSDGATQGKHQYTTVTGRMLYFNEDAPTASGCGQTGTLTSTYLPNVRLGMTLGCVGPRQAVVATITPGPAISIAKPATVCAGEIGNFVVSSTPMSNYSNYVWTPAVADLYTNATATTPYVSGSAPNVYFKSNDNGAHTYYLFSSGTTPAACTHADTFSVWVQPDSVGIAGSPDSICVSGTTTLSLVPATGYAANSVQWQESATGSNFTNITGATNPSYTTTTLTTNRYYRALVKSTNDTCEMPVKYVVVVIPQLIGVTDSFNCGPGTVTLKAQTGGNSTAKWYEAPTGGVAIGTNSPWTTPSLAASQTYYVSAEGGAGGGAPLPVTVGTGTVVNQYYEYPTPFGNYYGTSHDQYLVLASDLLSQGASPGNITSVAFDLANAYTAPTLKGFQIRMANTNVTTLNSTFVGTGMTVVRPAANYTPPAATGYSTINFSTPFNWTGGNIIVDVTFTNCTTCNTSTSCTTTWSSVGNGRVKQTNTTFNSAHSVYADDNCSISSMTPGGFYSNEVFTKRPNMRFGATAPCQTPRMPVQAYIHPKPAVDLGPDVNMCVDAGSAIVLDAGVQPNTPSFLWDDYSTSQVRAVNASGSYNVKVTNSYTCVGSDTVNILLRKNPVVNLGNDTTVCNGVILTLNPGSGGIEYFWSTGQSGQTININNAGSYSVFVTNSEGCVSMDTIQILMQGELPRIDGIQVSNDGAREFHFTAIGATNVIGYEWDFGDGSLPSYEASPSHEYDSAGDYIVVLHLSSTCGFGDDTISAHIVGIHQLNINNDELTVYPNPSNGQVTILNKGDLKMEKIEVYSILGQVVYRSKTDSKDKHVINLDNIASGLYTIEVYTDKGTVARKLEIIR